MGGLPIAKPLRKPVINRDHRMTRALPSLHHHALRCNAPIAIPKFQQVHAALR